MGYIKSKLASGNYIFSIENVPVFDEKNYYSFDEFDIITNKLVEMYKNEIVFVNPSKVKYDLIVPIIHSNKHYSEVNEFIANKLASLLNLKLVQDYFDYSIASSINNDNPFDEDQFVMYGVNLNYLYHSVIFFDYYCSTGNVLFEIASEVNKISSSENFVFLTYGINIQAEHLENSKIIEKNIMNNDFNLSDDREGYVINIYKMFGKKDVQIDFRKGLSVVIGENGYGKSTALRIAKFALNWDNSITYLQQYYFNKIEILNHKRVINTNYEKYGRYSMDFATSNIVTIEKNKGDLIYHKLFGYGKIIDVLDRSYLISFDKINGTKQISKTFYIFDVNPQTLEVLPKKYIINFKLSDNELYLVEHVYSGKLVNKPLDPLVDNLNFAGWYIDKELEKIFDFQTPIQEDLTLFAKFTEIPIYEIDITYFYYSDLIPPKDKVMKMNISSSLKSLFSTITEDEYNDLYRKSFNHDTSIKINFYQLYIKYNIDFSFKELSGTLTILTKEFKKNDSSHENLIHFGFFDTVLYFDCSQSKELSNSVSKVVSIKDDFSDYEYLFNNFGEDHSIILNEIDQDEVIEASQELLENYREANQPYIAEDDDEYNPYYDSFDYDDFEEYHQEKLYDMFYDEIEEQPEFLDDDVYILSRKKQRHNKHYYSLSTSSPERLKFLNDFDIRSDFDNYPKNYIGYYEGNWLGLYFENKNIELNKILAAYFDNTTHFTNFYYIYEYCISDSKCFSNAQLIDRFNNCYTDLDMEEIYNLIFNQKSDVLEYGIYDLLTKIEFEKLFKKIENIRLNKIKDVNDKLFVLNVFRLIESYENTIIPAKYILVEKIINKYLVGKKVKIYAKNIVIKDDHGEFIPINSMSTGEKNLISLIFFCSFMTDSVIILDEPDTSMSIDWQTKILVDLIKHFNHKFLIITQSPFLVHDNNLSSYVEKIDLVEDITKYVKYKSEHVSPYKIYQEWLKKLDGITVRRISSLSEG